VAGQTKRGRIVDWLLEQSQPWVRYNTLTDLLDAPRESAEVVEALAEAMRTPPISKILGSLDEDGGYRDDKSAAKYGAQAIAAGYMPKYRGTTWKLLFLAEAGADPTDEGVKRLADNLLRNAYSEKLGSFFLHVGGEVEHIDYIIPCWMGNMVWALCRFGFGGSPKVRSAFDWLVKYQRFDDGDWKTPKEFPYGGHGGRCWGRHTCYWGATSLLRAMTVVPEDYWTGEAEQSKRRGRDFILKHRLIWSSHTPARPVTVNATQPQRLTAPQIYYQDAVEITTTMLRLGARGGAVDETIEYILGKRNEDGKWILDNAPNNVDASFGSKGAESKWITFRALRMLKLAGRPEALG
jgi:hypothetical protein